MRVLLFSSQHYDQESFTRAASGSALELHFQPARLTLDTAALASGYEAVCASSMMNSTPRCSSAWPKAAHA